MSYVYITFNPSNSVMLRTGKYRTKQMKDMHKKVDIPPSCNVQSIWDDSKFCPEGRSLIMLIYVSKEELHVLRMHPESLAVDTNFRINLNKNELFTVAYLDSNNNACNGARGYIPNAQ